MPGTAQFFIPQQLRGSPTVRCKQADNPRLADPARVERIRLRCIRGEVLA